MGGDRSLADSFSPYTLTAQIGMGLVHVEFSPLLQNLPTEVHPELERRAGFSLPVGYV